ncbi:MAG: hypothetical protein WC842_02670 [Candidatus Paceibacterota bacterium]|jgi:hypothetical protein
MEKKIVISAVVSFLLGIGAYFLFVSPSIVENKEIVSETTSTVDAITTSTDFTVTFETKKTYTTDVKEKTITLYENTKKSGVVSANLGDIFVSAFPIDKLGDRFFVVVKHQNELIDFGILTSATQKFEMLTKESGIKDIVNGVVFSSEKQYAAFQYLRDQGECKKDLMLAVVNLIDGKVSLPEIQRSYEIGTGKLQSEMGGYRFDGDTTLQFMDMPRACDNSGDYAAQKYYSWNIKTGETKLMEF